MDLFYGVLLAAGMCLDGSYLFSQHQPTVNAWTKGLICVIHSFLPLVLLLYLIRVCIFVDNMV